MSASDHRGMRVLMTTDTVGGVWTYAVELAHGLAESDVEILLATAGAPLSDGQRRQLAALANVTAAESSYRLEWMPDPWDDVAAAGRWLLDLAADFRPDVVHLNDYSHAALDWPGPVMVVGHSCVLSWFEAVRGQPAGPEWDEYRRRVTNGLRAADRVVAPTAAMLGALERHYGPLPPSQVIPNGIELPRVRRETPKEDFIFAAGRWWDEGKNIAAIGRVADALPWPVRVAGLPNPSGGDVTPPEGLAFLGCLDADAMHATYARAAIYALPARYEPFGLTPLEAAFHGCALVLGDIPTLREVWGDAARFVPPDDADALAAALRELIDDIGLRAALAERCRWRASRYTAERMAREYFALYGLLTASPTMSLTR